ncbi:salicylate synthase [Romboutsia lituseburensis]|uniref:salicylate synthase n=1 Tax=Romboutsia lituseburensis TaxID=1537 RepID=UPI00215B2A14|nr:salicylate synthase [Romboutsia lituseburensis]MCR8746642.1 salicylate synthase [Romboutsia lituseburensis]
MITAMKKILLEEDYIEKKLKKDMGNINLYELGTSICDNSLYDEHVIYEKEKEISIGIGKKLEVIVNPKLINIRDENEEVSIETDDINQDIKFIFESIDIDEWRAYGIANFSLAYHNYNIESSKENSKLIELFIPKVDIRITEKEILIRTFYKKDLDNIIETIENFNKNLNNKNNDSKYISDTSLKEQNSQEYKYIVSKAVEDIQNKKYEKVILSRKITLDKKVNMSKSYILGRSKNNPARSYYVKLNGLEVIGYSPETVAEIDKNKIVHTFPLAGTRAMNDDEDKKDSLRKELLTDPKEISEHAVSVKLAYEELENVCEDESVCVTRFMDVLERGTVQHLASRLRGKIKENLNEWHAFNMLFPAVTASGIPKKECIEAISKLEKESRDLYSGSVMIYDKDGSLDASLVLRSVYQNQESTWLRAGAGIVKLSHPERELEETREKLSSVSQQLLEL